MNKKIASFFNKHHFDLDVDVSSISDRILYDMNLGLFGGEQKAGQDMFRTWMLPPQNPPINEKVIVIDAGGTNFRSCLVTFDSKGDFSISDFKKTSMPGVERELSKKEFFEKLADNIDYLKNKADRIGFCFSYAMNITEGGDGIPNAFSKEIKAQEVIGCPVGKCLCEELEKRGWNKIKKIALLNDTVAALLAGKCAAKAGTSYSSYIGFILGTGINAAYIQPEIKSKNTNNIIKNQIIVCEAGKCDKIPLSDFDISFDKKTLVPGDYKLEKQCSGAYLGNLTLEVLRYAAGEGLFSQECAKNIMELKSLSLIEMDAFLYQPFASGSLDVLCHNDDDRRTFYEIFSAIIRRCALNASAILSSAAIQSGAGKDPLHPLLILCNGTTFFKTHKLRSQIEAYLTDYLTQKKEIHFELLSLEDDITLGTAIAGLRESQ